MNKIGWSQLWTGASRVVRQPNLPTVDQERGKKAGCRKPSLRYQVLALVSQFFAQLKLADGPHKQREAKSWRDGINRG